MYPKIGGNWSQNILFAPPPNPPHPLQCTGLEILVWETRKHEAERKMSVEKLRLMTNS